MNRLSGQNCTGFPCKLYIENDKEKWYTKKAFTHTEDSATLGSGTSAVRGLAERVIPWSYRFFLLALS
jgi:hypothetical protein